MHACCKARRMYTFMFMYVSVSVYMYMYACKHTHTYIYTHTHIHFWHSRSTHTYIHTYITYIHTYTHTHAQLYLVGWVTGLGNQKCYNAHETYQQKQHSALLKVSVMTTGITKRRRSQELHVENSITETISRLQT